jgi:outer membrane protein OmpA-like peptidoglycan-associated protein
MIKTNLVLAREVWRRTGVNLKIFKKFLWPLFLTLGLLGLAVAAGAQLYDKGGALGLGARALGMGGAFSALAPDETAVYWNPAGLSDLDALRLNASLDSLYGGSLREAAFTAGCPLPAGAGAGFSWQHQYYPNSTQVNSDLLDLAGSVPLTEDDRLVLGTGLKFLFGSVLAANGDYHGLGLDVGLRYRWELVKSGPQLIFGARMQDVDTRLQWADGNDEQIPQSTALGTALQWDPATAAALDFEMIHAGQDIAEDTRLLRLGAEHWFKDILALRAGYLLDNHTVSTFTLGAGLRLESWQVDYAFLGQISDLGYSHRLSVSVGLPSWRTVNAALGPIAPLPQPKAEPAVYQLSLVANPQIFSPNHDGVADTTVFSLNILQGDRAQVAAWRLSIEDEAGTIVRYFDGAGVPTAVTWDGLDTQEKLCLDGTYTAHMLLADAREQRLANAQTQVLLVTRLPGVRLEVDPTELVLLGGQAERKVIFHTFGPEQLAGISWELTVKDKRGTLYKSYAGQNWLPKDISWAVSAKAGLPAGNLEAVLRLQDAAGNQKSSAAILKITRLEPEASLEVTPKIIKPGDPKEGSAMFTLEAAPKNRIVSWDVRVQNAETKAEVRTLSGAGAPPDTVLWDGKDNAGNTVNGGLYFQCRLHLEFKGNRIVESEPRTMASDVNDQDSGKSLALYLTSIAFEKGSYSIPLDTFRNLQQAAETIKRYATRYRVQVKGYTDTDEAPGHELELSRARAQRVSEYLTASGGIPVAAVESIGYGTINPLASEGTPSGQAKNRRVEVVLIIQK